MHWCQTTGSVRVSPSNRRKWSTIASMTRYGSAYFLSSSIRRKKLFVPLYSISARRSMAALECRAGIDTRLSTEEKMTASRTVHVPDWQRGMRIPL